MLREMAHWKYLVLLLLGLLKSISAKDLYIAAPSSLGLNSDETIAIAIDGVDRGIVDVTVREYPGKVGKIYQKEVPVTSGEPAVFKIHLNADSFPANFLTSPGSPKFVSLSAHFQDIHKEIRIPISNSKSGYVFIQTDKPIYTPRQSAFIRIIPLTEDSRPSHDTFQLQIRNPEDIIVEEKVFNAKSKKLRSVFANHIYKFPTYPVLGNWSATVRYGFNLNQNSTVRFELREYVLPTFTVELKTPDIVLPNDSSILVDVQAKYVYGRQVDGLVSFRLGLKRKYGKDVFFAVINPKELDEGTYTLVIKTDILKQHEDVGWFPGIDGSHLIVEATVLDYATGNKEVATDSRALFTQTPFVISFKHCLRDFRPGLTSVFVADINYVDGRPAQGVLTKVKVVADNGKVIKIDNTESRVRSDANGKVAIEIQPEMHHKTVTLTIETDHPDYGENQASGSFEQLAYQSRNNAYIAIARRSLLRLEPGDMFGEDVHFEPAGIQNVYYLVVARGKILSMGKLKPGAYKHQRMEFRITHDMVPSFRVVAFAHHMNDLVADSLKIDVRRTCHPDAKVEITPEFNQREPGDNGKIVIKGKHGTAVGLLGVDEAVYALSKQGLLTKEKVFDSLESHDLGCGPGGGVNVNSVLGNAGIMIGTNKFTPTHSHSCAEIRRRKRAAAREITKTYSFKDKQCCALGIEKDKKGRTCEERVPIMYKLNDLHPNCSKVFLECCLQGKVEGLSDLTTGDGMLAKMKEDSFDEPEFLEEEFDEEYIRQATKSVRHLFHETWIYTNEVIGPDNKEEVYFALPHSITTWVIQAVSVSPEHGICVAEPKKLVTFKKLFLQLNLPYSVVRNEQVEIQATIFNYADTEVKGYIFMYGVKDICSGLLPGERSEKKRIVIDANSAETVTFPLIPLKAGEFPIKVAVVTTMGSDVVQKKLNVAFEGVPKEIHLSLKLDPSNQQRRKRRSIEAEYYTDTIDPSQNIQLTAIKLSVPDEIVPGTTSCTIRAFGDMLGPSIETSLQNPDDLLKEPSGCGEQNMGLFAPLVYAMRYLKVTGKITSDTEEKGYGFIRIGYANQLNYMKGDGSYAAFPDSPPSAWLTAFVMKVFCQATELIYIDKNVICSGIRWLIRNQERDGSFIEKHASYKKQLMGGINGRITMTAFALIALEECSCDEENLSRAKQNAAEYLEDHFHSVNTPLPTAVVAYALSLSNSSETNDANDKLLTMAKYDENNNWMYWTTENSAQDIETTGYALLTLLRSGDMEKSKAIVNWLNSQQQQSGAFKSTQDTVVALQALSEFSIKAQTPSIDLVSNISSSNDRNFQKTLTLNKQNALVLQEIPINEVGGTIFIDTRGHGMGYLSVKLRYNLDEEPEDVCQFDVTVNVTDATINMDDFIRNRTRHFLNRIPEELINEILEDFEEDISPQRRRREHTSNISPLNMELGRRSKRESKDGNSTLRFNIEICVRYLDQKDTEMSIVDVEIFSGFEPVMEDLDRLEENPNDLISSYEKSARGVIFYLDKVPRTENYCFSFHVTRKYIVAKIQRSIIKVYDYYNPDASCTQFYNPPSNSPFLRAVCEGRVCECAEGGCPPDNPFSDLPTTGRTEELKTILCEDYDYVWIGTLDGPVKKYNGFLNISFTVDEVIKEGIEKASDIEGETRTLLARDYCRSDIMLPQTSYFLVGRDGQAYKNAKGKIWYRYLLDKTSAVFERVSSKNAKGSNRSLQRDMSRAAGQLKMSGCEL